MAKEESKDPKHRPLAALGALAAREKKRRALDQKVKEAVALQRANEAAVQRAKEAAQEPASKTPSVAASPHAATARKSKAEYEERISFRQAFDGVRPLKQRRGGTKKLPPASPTPREVDALKDERARARLDALVGGERSLTRLSDEQGFAITRHRASLQTVARLREGALPPSRELDLHGETAQQAKALLVQFLRKARRDGCSVVLVIHGRGKGSAMAGGVLSEVVRDDLQRGSSAPLVEAACAAPARLGGAGATIVVLRSVR